MLTIYKSILFLAPPSKKKSFGETNPEICLGFFVTTSLQSPNPREHGLIAGVKTRPQTPSFSSSRRQARENARLHAITPSGDLTWDAVDAVRGLELSV